MTVIKYPQDIGRTEFINRYASKLLACLKSGLKTSYEFDLNEDGNASWLLYFKKNLDDKVNYIVAEDKNIIKGYLVWKQHKDEVHFYDLIIKPENQLDMVTLRKLLKQFAFDIYDLKATKLWAYTNKKNKRMNLLLGEHGFEVFKVKERGIEYKADINIFIKKFIKTGE